MVFVARDRELAELRAAFDQVREGAAATVLVAGDAGVGKSRLVDEFATTLPGTTRVLTGGCLDLGDLPFAPFTSAFRALVTELGPAGVRELLPGAAAGELARLLPGLGSPPAGDAELARARLFEQVLALLRALAERAPTVLIVEDVHWADRSTRDLLTFLVGNQRAAPGLLVLVTCRTDLDRTHVARTLLADLARVGWVRGLDIGPLPEPGVAAQLRGLLGHEPDAGLVATVFARSEGNPLFVEALVACPMVPRSIRDLLLAPVTRLSQSSQDVIRAAAVCTVNIGHELLAAVTGLDEAALSAALRPVVAANVLVVDGDGYVFRHALIREVVCDDLLPGERARLHVRYAEALERDPALAPPGQLARHWGAVAGRHPLRALTAAWRAAEDAGRALAHAEQLHMLTEVLRLWDQVPDGHLGVDRRAVLAAATDAAVAAGDVTRALAMIETQLSEVDIEPVSAGLLRMRRGQLRHALGQPDGIGDLRAAIALVPSTHPAAATVLGALAHRLLVVPCEDEGRVVAEQAITAARRVGDARTEVMATADLAHAHARAGDLDAQLPVLRRARATAERLGDDVAVLHVLRLEADVLQGQGRYPAAAEVARQGLAVCAAAGLTRTSGPIHAANLAEPLIALGDWDEAVRVIDDALGPPAIPGPDAYLLVLHGIVRLARGDLAGAGMAAAYAREVFARGYPDTQDLLPLARLEIDLALAEGRGADAAALVTDALALPEAQDSPRYLWPVLASGAQVVDLRAVANTLPVVGPVQRAHQLTFTAAADPDAAAWDRAAAAWAELGEPYACARALLAAAETGDHDAAAARLRTAATHAARLAPTPLSAEIDRLAKAFRVRLAEPDDRHGLTARELEVLRLLAEGHTNRQIATELYISAKTVSTHVSNILTKLAVPGRVQAATAAHRLNLLPVCRR